MLHSPNAVPLPDPPTPECPGLGRLPELKPIHVEALDLLASGMTTVQVAARLNIDRATLYRWRTQHPTFIAAANRRYKDTLDATSSRCLHLLTDALDVVQQSVAGKRSRATREKAAFAILGTFGSRKLLLPAGPTSSNSVLRHLTMQRRIELRAPLNPPITAGEIHSTYQDIQDQLESDPFPAEAVVINGCR